MSPLISCNCSFSSLFIGYYFDFLLFLRILSMLSGPRTSGSGLWPDRKSVMVFMISSNILNSICVYTIVDGYYPGYHSSCLQEWVYACWRWFIGSSHRFLQFKEYFCYYFRDDGSYCCACEFSDNLILVVWVSSFSAHIYGFKLNSNAANLLKP